MMPLTTELAGNWGKKASKPGGGKRFGSWAMLLVGMAMVVAACGSKVGVGDYSSPEAAGMERLLREDEILKAINEDAKLVVFLERLEKAVMSGDGEFLRGAVDTNTLMGRVMEGTPEGSDVVGLRTGFVKGTTRAWRIAGVLEAFSGQHYRFLRARTIGDWQGVLYRATEDDGQLNYHLHCLVRDGEGNYRIADTYVVGLSESVSATLRRGFEHLVADHRSESGSDIGSESVAFVNHLESIGKLGNALMNRRYAEALDLYHALPDEVQRMREVMLMRVEAAAKVSPLMLDEALDLWKDVYEDERLLPLKFIDYHMARGKYDRASELASYVETMTGGDPYLRVKRGELAFAVENSIPPVRMAPRRSFRRGGATQGRK